MLGYYYKIQDETLGIMAGTIESPVEIEERLQDWQKEQKIYDKINEKYGTPEERIAKIEGLKKSLEIIKGINFTSMKEDVFSVSGVDQNITTLSSTILALIDVCEKLVNITLSSMEK